jgi:D-glycero-D-manno-heptose 1,7-bisphosphate phosphatase
MKLIILDRDGVINKESRDYIKSPDEWQPIPGSLEAIAKLNQNGYTVVIATNQSGIARGYYDLQTLDAIHNKMHTELAKLNGKITKIYFCPHGPDDGCECRKPKPGMCEQIARDFNIDLNTLHPIFVGDSMRDYQIASSTGCKFYLVTGPHGDGMETLHKLTAEQLQQVTVLDDLEAVANKLCKNHSKLCLDK